MLLASFGISFHLNYPLKLCLEQSESYSLPLLFKTKQKKKVWELLFWLHYEMLWSCLEKYANKTTH